MKKILVIVLFLTVGLSLFFLKKTFNIKSKDHLSSAVILNWKHSPEKITIENPVDFSFTLKDPSSLEITNAKVNVEATMNHSGMIPVFSEAVHKSGGQYHSRIKLTMAGDWLLFLTITLNNGDVVKKEVTFTAR